MINNAIQPVIMGCMAFFSLKKHKKHTVFIQLWRLFSNFVPVNEHVIV